jgi:uncharacterized membrane protein YqaE (UPF0057 family)
MGFLGTFLLVIVAILLPPLAVALSVGCNKDFFINLLLTLLGYIPGIIHALYIVFTRRDRMFVTV